MTASFGTACWTTMRCALVVVVVSGLASADPGIRIGPRAGIGFRDHVDPYIGVDLRLVFSRSPLTINPTFDYLFDNKETLYQLSVNALYDLPPPIARLDPYVGIGVDVTGFSLKESTPGVDDTGSRLGMNLIAGACFELPIASPFVQVVKEIGEFDLVSIGVGLAVALDRDDRWTGCGRRTR